MRITTPVRPPLFVWVRPATAQRILLAWLILCAGYYGISQAVAEQANTPSRPAQDQSPFTIPFEQLWKPWTGDLTGMVERRMVRVVVPYGGYQFYYDGGEPKGAVYELLKKLEAHLNEQLGRRNIRVYVAMIPMSRDKLLPALLAGNADLVAADLTETEQRNLLADFTRPLLTDIDEIVVSGPESAPISSIDDLSGREIFVRASSSYHEHLIQLVIDFQRRGMEPPKIVLADELLEAHDIVEMVNAGLIDLTVVDDYKAEFWNTVFPKLTLHPDLAIHEGGQTAWAYRKDSPELAALQEVQPVLDALEHGCGGLLPQHLLI